MTTEIKLTQFSKGGGCGCKIAPSVLQKIVETSNKLNYANLLVGYESNDDAAVFQIDNENAIISTTDFFMPIVDDPFQFGRIASANAISDVYAMGGKPLMAIAILGWPVDKIPAEIAKDVLNGSRDICSACDIPLAGGHTIDSQEPIFGLAVTGTVKLSHLKRNNTAQVGDYLLFTKKLGVGIMATAIKRAVITANDYSVLINQLTSVNSIGEKLGKLESVHSMTDVTGFGFLGHLTEMAKGSNLTAEIYYDKIKKLEGLDSYLKLKTIPGATSRNWNSYSDTIQFNKEDYETLRIVLSDPQTNGGLLISVSEEGLKAVQELFISNQLDEFIEPVGRFKKRKEKAVYIN